MCQVSTWIGSGTLISNLESQEVSLYNMCVQTCAHTHIYIYITIGFLTASPFWWNGRKNIKPVFLWTIPPTEDLEPLMDGLVITKKMRIDNLECFLILVFLFNTFFNICLFKYLLDLWESYCIIFIFRISQEILVEWIISFILYFLSFKKEHIMSYLRQIIKLCNVFI